MPRLLLALVAVLVVATAAAPRAAKPDPLKAGLLLYAAPGLPDPNFAKTVVLLLDHSNSGSIGVVINRPTGHGLEAALDLKPGALGVDVPLYQGGPVQPKVLLALLRTVRPDSQARSVVRDVYLTQDLDEIRDVLAGRNPSQRLRAFSGYAGWDRGQLAAEMRTGSWVIDTADAARVFSPEPSRLWDKVHEILARVQANLRFGPRPPEGLLSGNATSVNACPPIGVV